MSILKRLRTDKKFLFITLGIVLATLIVPHLTIPGLALWWFYKTPKLSKNSKRLATGVVGGILIIGLVGCLIAYANDPEPHLTVTEPATNLTTQAREISIKGTFDPTDRKVWVNGNRINASNGSFETSYQLTAGENKIEVSAGDWKRSKVLLTVNHELSEAEKQAQTTPTNAPTSSPQQQKQIQSPEQQIEARIRNAVSKRTNMDKDKLTEVKVNKAFDGSNKYVAVVTMNGDDNLSDDFIKKGIWKDMADIYSALYKSYSDIKEATIIAKFPMSDKYGKTSDEVVLKTSLSDEEAKKVNWNADKATLELQILPQVWTTQTNRFR